MKKDIDGGQKQGEEEVRVLHPLSYMSGNLKKKMEEVLGCRFVLPNVFWTTLLVKLAF